MITNRISEDVIEKAKTSVLEIVKRKPLFVVIDSREQYAVSNHHEMWITAGLVQCASEFNVRYSNKGLHLKVCIADEVFPYLKEQFVTNTLKYVRDPLYMYWRPKDLLRLVCWRFYKYLQVNDHQLDKENGIDWDSYKAIYENIWTKYFGRTIVNLRGVREGTFPYILRHTHLRPRQLIVVCNRMAKIAYQKDEFPYFSSATIKEGIMHSEIDLSDELINSYSSVYPNAGDIIASLAGMPMEFQGNLLYVAAHRSAGYWTDGNYSPLEFIKLVTELGIVGRKRGKTDEHKQIVKADFEFALKDRLFITEKDTCVIHPLFYSKLNINRKDPQDFCVYPFPNNPDFHLIEEI